MTDEDLKALLRSVPEPARTPEYWEQFPAEAASAAARESRRPPAGRPHSPSFWIWQAAWAVGGLAVVLAAAISLVLVSAPSRPRSTTPDLSACRKTLLEMEGLFPGQLRSVVMQGNTSQVLVADARRAGPGQPAMVSFCQDRQCTTVLTFSGESVSLGGQTVEVLADRNGGVILVGSDYAWRTGEPAPKNLAGMQAALLGESL